MSCDITLIPICAFIFTGWTMVFKAVTRKGKVYELYTSDNTSSEDVKFALDVTKKYPHHYKNRIVLNWEDFKPSEVISLGLSPTQSNNTLGTTPPLNSIPYFPLGLLFIEE